MLSMEALEQGSESVLEALERENVLEALEKERVLAACST